jgi:hypothetical protein
VEKSISFRADLLSNTLDLLKEIDIECARTANLVVAVASALAAYTEEGSPLTPSVFICNSISDLVKRSGVGEFVPLSRPISMENAATSILKAAAPVCSRTWNVYVERSHDGKTCQFGVFCGSLIHHR